MSFKALWWLKGPHLQTLWAACCRKRLSLDLFWERLELLDGDFLDLVWTHPIQLPHSQSHNKTAKPAPPIVILLHGLNGSIHSPYIQGMLQAIQKQQWRGVLLHFRGCSGEPNRLARAYHSGDTQDLKFLVEELKTREPHTPIYIIGYSLGGNVVLKWLGETGNRNPVQAAVAVSVPFELEKAVDHLNRGPSRIYQWKLLRGLIKSHQKKFNHPSLAAADPCKAVDSLGTFWEFDDNVTAPLHGFKNALDYYTQSSSRSYLKSIKIPTLIIQAENDPFLPRTAVPTEEDISSAVTLEVSKDGGHVGFIAGKYFFIPEYWLEKRVLDYFAAVSLFAPLALPEGSQA